MAEVQADKTDGMLKELQAIKKLLVFALLRAGGSQQEIADALGVGQASISRMFPTGKTRKKTAKARKKGV